MVAKYIPCYCCGNKYKDVDIVPGLFSVEEKVVDWGSGHSVVREPVVKWNLALVTCQDSGQRA